MVRFISICCLPIRYFFSLQSNDDDVSERFPPLTTNPNSTPNVYCRFNRVRQRHNILLLHFNRFPFHSDDANNEEQEVEEEVLIASLAHSPGMEEDAPPPAIEESGHFDFDPDYEFHAPRFFDFCSPESQSDVDAAESWFRNASSYPPSPFVIELMWNQGLKAAALCSNASNVFEQLPSSSSVSVVSNTTGCLSAQDDRQIALATLKSGVKKTQPTISKGSTLMKPTASHLAKLNHRKEISKPAKPLAMTNSVKNNQERLQNSVKQNQATKRQKLETGFLRKVAHLNHQTVFSHKKTTEVSQLGKKSIDPKKVTIPKEPKLETARRALIRSSRRKDTAEHDRDTESTNHSFKAHPLNKKIFQTPSVSLRKRTTPSLPEIQEFPLNTSERALRECLENAISMPESISISQTESTVSERSSYANSPTRQRNETAQFFHDKASLSSMGKKISQVPPIELFSKLSLISGRQRNSSIQNY